MAREQIREVTGSRTPNVGPEEQRARRRAQLAGCSNWMGGGAAHRDRKGCGEANVREEGERERGQ